MDSNQSKDDAVVAAPIRAACADLHPSDAVRAAVLLGLATRPPAPLPSRRWRIVVMAAGLAAAAVVGALLWPRGESERGTLPESALPPHDCAADRGAQPAEIARQRAENQKVYREELTRSLAGAKGMWAMISAEPPPDLAGAFKPVVIGHSAEEVGKFAPHAKHRYVFRVGDEGDVETFVSEWYAPRFAGSGFAKALGVTVGEAATSIAVRKGDALVSASGATPYPRLPIVLATPGSKPAVAAGPRAPEFWLGSVGPTLMLTPEDDAALALSRWEVPGTETVMGVPCRRVVVEAAIPGIPGSASVVAAVPAVARETLVGLARTRDEFWKWPDALKPSLDLPDEGDSRGQWIVFGNDRILGRGPTTETALADADARLKDVVYHRFVLRHPLADTFDHDQVSRDDLRVARTVVINGVTVAGHSRHVDDDVFLADDECSGLAVALGLPLSEPGLLRRFSGIDVWSGFAFVTNDGVPGARPRFTFVGVPKPADAEESLDPPQAPRPPSELAALVILTNLISCEVQIQASAKIDEDQDGDGEFGGFAELSGNAAGRMGKPLAPPVLPVEKFRLNGDGVVERAGYRFRIWLPGADGIGVGEPSAGFTRASKIDPNRAEERWCCYAWPGPDGERTSRTFFVCEGEDITATVSPQYLGSATGPPAGAAFDSVEPGGLGSIDGRPALDKTGRDGSVWSRVK